MKLAAFSRVLCVGFLCVTSSIQAETIAYQDNFDRKDGEDGLPLNTRPIGKSDVGWEATPNAVLAKGAGIRAADDNTFVCRVALPSELKEVTIEANVNPNPAGKGWLSVGMGNGTLKNPTFGGLYFFVFPGGFYTVMFNPDPEDTRAMTAVVLKRGSIQTWNPYGMNSLRLVYNKGSESISAFANGDEELVRDMSLEEKNFSLQADFAGVSGVLSMSEEQSVGKFSATILK